MNSVEVGVSYGTCQAVLTQDLNMWRVAAKFVPWILTAEQKEWCLSVATNMLQEAESSENFIGANHHRWWDMGLRVWPGDKASVFAVEVCWFPEAKESAPGAVKIQSHAHCFLWYGGHCSLWVCSTRANCKPTVLSTSFEMSETWCFSQEATETGGGGLGATLRQCTRTHSTTIQIFLASHGIPIIQQPPYSPDMAPCDFWLFPQLKTVLKGKRFEDIDAIKKNATSTLNTVPGDSLKKCFQQWQYHWKQCVSS